MQVIVGERNEAVFGVEVPGVGIDGQDFDCKQAELFGQIQAATQGIAQESLPKPLTPGFLIDGQPPDLSALPAGCSFAPRCPQAFARCRDAAPPPFAPEEGRTARCWLAEPSAVGSDFRVASGAL